ncbi:hypothetical protein D1007_26911 [Hordeum vulgare]|nr:hypothetical protein D1007_26911 [Hordeum vulgare]
MPFMELHPNFEPNDDEDPTRRHDYSRSCYHGRVDGTGCGSCPRSHDQPFDGPGGLGVAGDLGGGKRLNGLFLPACGIAVPFLKGAGSVARPGATDTASDAVISHVLTLARLRGPAMDSVARSSATTGASVTMITPALAWPLAPQLVAPLLLGAWPSCWGGPCLGGFSRARGARRVNPWFSARHRFPDGRRWGRASPCSFRMGAVPGSPSAVRTLAAPDAISTAHLITHKYRGRNSF